MIIVEVTDRFGSSERTLYSDDCVVTVSRSEFDFSPECSYLPLDNKFDEKNNVLDGDE